MVNQIPSWLQSLFVETQNFFINQQKASQSGSNASSTTTVYTDPSVNAPYKLVAASTALYGSSAKPAWQDIHQGAYGDCYLMSTVAELADQSSSWLSSSIVQNSNGSISVRFFNNGKAVWVTESDSFSSGGALANEQTYSKDSWGAVLEKAWVEFCYAYKPALWQGNTLTSTDSYTSLNGGISDYVFKYLTGDTTSDFSAGSYSKSVWDGAVFNALSTDYAKGESITFANFLTGYDAVGNEALVADHEYFVLGFNAANKTVELGNPWGNTGTNSGYDATIWASMDLLSTSSSNYFTVCNSAGVQNAVGQLTSAMATSSATASAAAIVSTSLSVSGAQSTPLLAAAH